MTGTETRAASADSVLTGAQEAVEQGRWRDAIEALMEANRTLADPAIEELLVSLRHSGYRAVASSRRDPTWPPATADLFEERGTVPEVRRENLTAEVLGSALEHHGSLIVRNLLVPEAERSLLAVTQRAMEVAADCESTGLTAGGTPWFKSFEPDEGYVFEPVAQRAARLGGCLLIAESPRALHDVVAAYRQSGLGDVLCDYLHEWPALSVKKSTLRRADPDSPRGWWHQDGAFLGTDVHTVNVWTALTPCGVDAPGIELFAQPFDHLAATGTEGAHFTWSVSDEMADSYGEELKVQPRFDAGDALLFNQMTLHRTGIEPTMTKTRYALETWFFGPSSYPEDQVPLLF